MENVRVRRAGDRAARVGGDPLPPMKKPTRKRAVGETSARRRVKRPERNQPDEEEDELAYPWEEAIQWVRDLRAGLIPEAELAGAPVEDNYGGPDDYIGWVPTPMRVVHRMLAMAEIKPGETVYDLGCGDGRILIAAARNYGARGVGIDIDRERLADVRRRAGPFLNRIILRRQNVFKVDLRPADVVTIYLLPGLNRRLLPRLQKLKRGARVVSHCFELPGVVAHKVASLKAPNGRQHSVYLYRTPMLKTERQSPL
jgi:SAM-dependent methyltransferase